MTDQKIIQDLKSFPVIPAIRDIERVNIALSKKPKCIFLLTGNILNIKKIVDRVKESNKTVFLHLDLLEGISKDSMGIKYIAQEIKPDGIITTRANLINYAKNEGLFTIQRIFVLDSPDAVEILPAVIPKVIGRICRTVRHPVIAGGLIENTAEVEAAIKEGAWAISVTKEDIWDYTF